MTSQSFEQRDKQVQLPAAADQALANAVMYDCLHFTAHEMVPCLAVVDYTGRPGIDVPAISNRSDSSFCHTNKKQ